MHITSTDLRNLEQVIKETELERYEIINEQPYFKNEDVERDEIRTEKTDYIAGLLEYCNKFTDF
jgi:hypothetical protein